MLSRTITKRECFVLETIKNDLKATRAGQALKKTPPLFLLQLPDVTGLNDFIIFIVIVVLTHIWWKL